MPNPLSAPEPLRHLREFAPRLGNVVAREAYGPDGPPCGTSLADMERAADAAADGLLAGILDTCLHRHAARLDGHARCPACGLDGPVAVEPRTLLGDGGEVTSREPFAHCPACRRDFFPSAS